MAEEKKIEYKLSELETIVELLKDSMPRYKVFTFSGQLGAGKSTLIRALLRSCGIQGVIASPTFTYMNAYENEQGQYFYHFDLYRINSLDAFVNAGFNEYLYQPNSWCFIEWPELIMPLLMQNACHISIEYLDQNQRKIEIRDSI